MAHVHVIETARPGKDGTGQVDSVNGYTGAVVLDADAIDDTATAHRFVTAAERETIGTTAAALADHTSAAGNPHGVTAVQVGLGNVPNVDARARATHLGTQAISTVDGLQAALNSKAVMGHLHDERYYTESEVNALLVAMAPVIPDVLHTNPYGNVTTDDTPIATYTVSGLATGRSYRYRVRWLVTIRATATAYGKIGIEDVQNGLYTESPQQECRNGYPRTFRHDVAGELVAGGTSASFGLYVDHDATTALDVRAGIASGEFYPISV